MEKTIEIPEGYEARIEGSKIILESKESEDERIRKDIIQFFRDYHFDRLPAKIRLDTLELWGEWLEKQGTYKDTLFKIATILSQYEDKEDSPLEKIRSIMIDGTICSMDLERKKK